MTKKSLLGNRAVYVAMMDIRIDMVVTRAAYRRPHESLLNNIKPYYIHNSIHTASCCLQYITLKVSETAVSLLPHQKEVSQSPIMVMVSLRRCSFSAATLTMRKVTNGVKARTRQMEMRAWGNFCTSTEPGWPIMTTFRSISLQTDRFVCICTTQMNQQHVKVH